MSGTAQIFPVVGESGGSTIPNPLPTDVTQWDSTNLGAPTNWGTPPSGIVIGGNVELFAGNSALVADGSNHLYVNTGAGLILASTAQVSVAATATLISAASATQAGVLITNPSSTVTVYIGGSGVTTSTGAILGPGLSITIPTISAVYGIVATSTQTVSVLSLSE